MRPRFEQVRVIGHRGNPVRFPENTMASFRGAIEAGAHMLELDVWLSRDGLPVVVHDPTVGNRPVGELSAADLAAWGVPLLAEVLALGVPLNVELKEAAALPAVVELVRERPDVIVSSFDVAALAAVPDSVARAYLVREPERCLEVLALARAAGAVALNPPRSAVTPELVAAAHSARLLLWPFTVNDPTEARRFFAWGVDAICTDDPASMLAILGTCAEVAE